MAIRNARDADFMACVRISRRAWPEFHERESIYHLFCKFFSNTSFVDEHEGEIRAFLLGFLSQVDDHQAYIHLVAVAPEHQRHGLAGDLYHHFFRLVGRMGRRRVGLIVNPDNAASIAFHRKLGFSPEVAGPTVTVAGVEATKDYNGPGNPMVVFSRTL